MFFEIFQDVDGGYSMKRFSFFMFTLCIVFCVGAAVAGMIVPQFIWSGLVTLNLTTGGFILAERAPQALASVTGNMTASVSPSQEVAVRPSH